MKKFLQNRTLCLAIIISVLVHVAILSFGLTQSAFNLKRNAPAIELVLVQPKSAKVMKAGGPGGIGGGPGGGGGSGNGIAGDGSGGTAAKGVPESAGLQVGKISRDSGKSEKAPVIPEKVSSSSKKEKAPVPENKAIKTDKPAEKANKPAVKTEKQTKPAEKKVIAAERGSSRTQVPVPVEPAAQQDERSLIFKKNKKGTQVASNSIMGGRSGSGSGVGSGSGTGTGTGRGGSGSGGGGGYGGRPVITANTRDVGYAMYYKALRKKIENQGLINFPQRNGNRLYGELTVRIPVYYDGTLFEKEGGPGIERSSGNRALDQAALNIVRRAAPFGPFPKSMRPANGGADVWIIITRLKFTREGDTQEQVRSTVR